MKKLLLTGIVMLYITTLTNGQQVLTAADSARYSFYWWHSKDMYDHLPVTKGAIVFLGNSITDGAEWSELLGNRKCINRGISADVTEGVLLRLQAVTKLRPSKIFIMIGVNDISKNITTEEITVNYRKILQQIRTETPGTKIFVESVLPVNPVTNPKIPHTSKTEQIKELNNSLRILCSEYGCTYIDLFSLMADENSYLPGKYSLDGLHLTYAAYKVWADAIKQYLR